MTHLELLERAAKLLDDISDTVFDAWDGHDELRHAIDVALHGPLPASILDDPDLESRN